ncbi:ATP-dependent DNA helicase [Pseudalkalibacillus berkeleyi]|uniref:ATP-dependent DNA helicase n=1 Tax=Pseudalkalibacillus berkeleyi TaxID=1069813 RepID=A0ABS9H5P9_9BACL|nr:ATP-dependent DNA helicase [Pseudalkalibacillus berkeleyi]MCF6139221.1 ATP-dependent DNA helicase [Pseudalkalibacillus berkeleyi]
MTRQIRMSVRPLVEYVYRSGSIDNRFRSASTMTDGTIAHQKIQKTYQDTDEKEVMLKTAIEYAGLNLQIEGRCDGLLRTENGTITIDEIKSTRGELSVIEADSNPVHWAQAKFYAYIYALDHQLESINVQLTYVHVETEEKKQFVQQYSFQALKDFVMDVIGKFEPYATLLLDKKEKRNESIQQLDFPFGAYRAGQRKFAGTVYKSIADQQDLFANAPTGTGKTISTIFPAVKAMGEGHLERMFYLTAKTITRTAAEDTLRLMKEKGLELSSVTITAKDKVCFKEKTICQKEYCEYADGYYDRLNGGILDILAHETLMDRQTIEVYAHKHKLCPFEFSLDLAYTADAMIGDYNYIFDPRISLKRLLEEQKKQTALLVDEAHNLVDRARNMFSAELFKSVFLQLKRSFKEANPGIYETAKSINEELLAIKKRCGDKRSSVAEELPEDFIVLLDTFVSEAEKELIEQKTGEEQEELLEAYFSAKNFVRIAELYDERYVTFVEYERSEVKLKLFCIDPSHLLQQFGKGYRSKVYFSATLSPISYFKDMLGAKEEDYVVSIPSPFAKENADVFIQPLSTRYRDRDRSVQPILSMLKNLIQTRPGNYLTFFPSYAYMNLVLDGLEEEGDFDCRLLIQNNSMDEAEREEFLAQFEEGKDESLLGFAVMGGIFSEGIDLKGDRLNGVVVVGVGLPQLNDERNIIKDYFTKNEKNGYDYAYVYPGMNKVLQAGGRLIRTEEDYGTIVLVDDRFLTPKYQQLIPPEWMDFKVIR